MSKRILVVDDEPDIVEVVRLRLEANNYEVIAAYDGEEGLRKARNEQPDLIILDILMPEMDGYTFVRELKADESIKDIPIVVLTAKDKMRDLFAIEGIKDYIVKPFKGEELVKIIGKYL